MSWLTVAIVVAVARGGQDRQGDPWIRSLEQGRLVLERVGFKPEGTDLVGDSEQSLERAARALGRTVGRFVVVVSPERQSGLPPDTVLARRRAEEGLRRLLAAGSNPARLVGLLPTGEPVAPGRARIELVRVY